MSGCNRKCSPGCGCHDFSSRAARLPSLASIEVVESIFTQAVANTIRRVIATDNGEMSTEELEAADNRLAEWLGRTFAGENKHYQSAEDWNPNGLAEYIENVLGERISENFGYVRKGGEDMIYVAASLFVADMYAALQVQMKLGGVYEGSENSPGCRRLIDTWSCLMTGAPVEML